MALPVTILLLGRRASRVQRVLARRPSFCVYTCCKHALKTYSNTAPRATASSKAARAAPGARRVLTNVPAAEERKIRPALKVLRAESLRYSDFNDGHRRLA